MSPLFFEISSEKAPFLTTHFPPPPPGGAGGRPHASAAAPARCLGDVIGALRDVTEWPAGGDGGRAARVAGLVTAGEGGVPGPQGGGGRREDAQQAPG